MTPDMTIKPRILLCHHEDGHVTHYVGGRRVSAAAFRRRFRELIEQGLATMLEDDAKLDITC